MAQFDKLLDIQVQMTHGLDLFHGQSFEIAWVTTLNRHTGEEEDLTTKRLSMHRICVYHVGQDHISRAAAFGGEIIATMCWECLCYQVDVMAGDGNKAAYLCTPKNPGCPTYEVSLLQF